MITFPTGRFAEETTIVGTRGRIRIMKPSHHPTRLEVHTGGYEPVRPGSMLSEHGWIGRREGWAEPGQHGVHVCAAAVAKPATATTPIVCAHTGRACGIPAAGASR